MLQEIFKKQHELSKKYNHIEIHSGIGYGVLREMITGQNNRLVIVPVEFDLNEQRSQYLCKDFAWRITEEMTECTECLIHSDAAIEPTTIEHAREELIDALHFLIELYILCGIDCRKLSLYSIDYIHNYNLFSEGIRKDCVLSDSFPLVIARLLKRSSTQLQSTIDHGPNSICFCITTTYSQAYKVIEYIGRAMNCLKQKPWKQTHVLTDVKRFEKNLCLAFYEWVTVAYLLGMNAESVYNCYFKKAEVNKFRQESQY